MSEVLDVAVIGAGPAGCAAAVNLARHGSRVALIESRAFPRAKVCGEFVSPAATMFLERLLPAGRLRELGATTVDRFFLERGGGAVSIPMPAPAWVLSRRTLDHALVGLAMDARVDVRQPVAVRTVDHDHAPGFARVTLGDGAAIDARLVVHADGSGRFAPGGRPTPTRPNALGLKCHLGPGHGVRGIRIRAADRAYVGSVAIEGGGATVALVAHTDLVKDASRAGPITGDGGDELLRRLWPGYDASLRASPWLSCGVAASRFTPTGHPRAVRAGNAAAAVEPVGGEGIGLALFAGTTIADLARRHGLRDDGLRRIAADYAGAYRGRLRLRRPACRLASVCLSSPRVMSAFAPLLRAAPTRRTIVGAWYHLSGKPRRPVGV